MRKTCLILVGLLGASTVFAANKTVMCDDAGSIQFPQSLTIPTGNITAVSASFSNLTVNGISVIVSTGGLITVNGLASNQVGSLSGARNVINNPAADYVLSYNGANAAWIPESDINYATHFTAQTISAQSAVLTTATITRLSVGGTAITNFDDITGSSAGWANYKAATNINVNSKGITNASFIQLSGITITSWNDLTNAGISGLPTNWSQFPAVFNINAGGLYATNLAGLQLGGDTITSWQDLTNQMAFPPTNWATFKAVRDIDGNGNYITNLTAIGLDGELLQSWGGITNLFRLNASNWSSYKASLNVDMNNLAITNCSSIQVGGQTITNFSSTTNVTGWSEFPAIQYVDMASNIFTNVTTIYFMNGGHITTSSGKMLIGD